MRIFLRLYISLTLLLISGISLKAQVVVFKGQLVDSEKKLPVADANIYSKMAVVYSNADGSFDFKFDKRQHQADTIFISCLGFRSVKVLADTIKDGLLYRIEMPVHAINLNEIVISDTRQKMSPEEIVSKAVTRLQESVSGSAFALEAFFKQTNLLTDPSSNDAEYLRYVEAALYLSYDSKDKYNSVIREVRRSNDNRFQFFSKDEAGRKEQIIKEEQRFDLSANFLNLDYARPGGSVNKEYNNTYSLLDPSIGNLHNDFVNRHKFKLDTISAYDDEVVYVIKILPAKNSVGIKSGMLKDYYLPIGRLFISGNDFSILEIQYSYIRNPRKKDNIKSGLARLMNQGDYVFRDVVKYKRENDKLFLSYMMREQADTLFMGGFKYVGGTSKTGDQAKNNGYFKVKRELFITRVVVNRNDIAKLDLTKKYTTLFPSTYDYNKKFWNDLNKTMVNAFEREKLDDLGKGKSLEEQFIENGKLKN